MSLDPIPLALGNGIGRGNSDWSLSGFDDAEEERERDRKAKLVAKLKKHTVNPSPSSPTDSPLLVVLNQINCSFEMSALLHSNISLVGARAKRSLSVSERVVESASTLWEYLIAIVWGFLSIWLYPVFRRSLFIGLLSHRVVAEVILRVLEWRLRPEHAALKDISATAQQVDIRLQQFCYWPFQYLTLRKRKDVWESVTQNHPDYIRFYNSLWLVANDVIIGIALGLYTIDHSDWVAHQINLALSRYTVDGLRRIITWLMDWPAGLKLNNELAAFLGDLFLWVIDYWAGLFERHPSQTTHRANRGYRVRPGFRSTLTTHHLLYRRQWLRGGYDAHLALFRLGLHPDGTHLLLLYCLGPDLQLATDDHHLVVPSLSRQETKCASKSNRFM